MGRQREDRTVWQWLGKDKEQGKDKDAEAGMSLGDGEEACSKGVHMELWLELLLARDYRQLDGCNEARSYG